MKKLKKIIFWFLGKAGIEETKSEYDFQTEEIWHMNGSRKGEKEFKVNVIKNGQKIFHTLISFNSEISMEDNKVIQRKFLNATKLFFK